MTGHETVESVLKDIEVRTQAMQYLVRETFQAGSALRTPDLLLLGVLKRVMSTSRGFAQLVRARNFLCAAPLVRFQLDSALRFYGVLITPDPSQSTSEVLGGARIDRMMDDQGERLRDHHLVKRLAKFYPWVPRIYEQASAYVHLSTTHMFGPVHRVDDDGGTVLMLFTEEDVCATPQHWLDLVQAFRETTQLVGEVFGNWLSGHPNASAVASKLESRRSPASDEPQPG